MSAAVGELMETNDQYKCVCLCNLHLSEMDIRYLNRNCDDGMVMVRDTGWFVKLFDAIDDYEGVNLPPGLKQLIEIALKAGFNAIEFDGDGTSYKSLPTYW